MARFFVHTIDFSALPCYFLLQLLRRCNPNNQPRRGHVNTTPTPICRTFTPQIQETSRWDRSLGGIIKPKQAPQALVAVSTFLEKVLPGKAIAHLARKEMVDVLPYSNPSPSCLFFQAVHACFSKHYPLTLRPEVLMQLIVGEVATTVKRHPDEYRHLFTRAPDKTRIDVRHDGLRPGDPESPWGEVAELFDLALRKVVSPGIMEHMLPSLSTATPETTVASLIAFMDAAQKFYDYHTHTLCGIPEIRLAGCAEDYKKILRATAQLAEVFDGHLGPYFTHLIPVLQTLAAQANGAKVDESFWKSIYKFESHSGTDCFNGWLTAFINYVQTAPRKAYGKTPATPGELVSKPENLYDWTESDGGHSLRGLGLGSVPSHVSTAPFTWHYFGEEHKMLFVAGVLGIEECAGSVMPMLSYGVLHDE